MKLRTLFAFLLSIVAGLHQVKAQTSYDVWLAGTRVTSENRNNVLGDGTVSYDVGSNTLTLKNANITADEAYGLHSKMPLNIKLEGENRISVVWKSAVFFQKGSTNGTVTILGYGSLIVTSDYTPIIAQLDLVIKNGAKLTLKSSGDYTGINGLSNGTRLPTLTLQGIGTELKAKGGSPGSLTDFSALNLSDGITIKEPAGATFTPNVGVVKNGALVANDWVVIAGSEPYACYTSSNTTLTFYCDKLRSSRTGTTYDLNAGTNNAGWETDGTNDNVTKVVFDPSFADARPTTTYSWFYEMRNLQTITGMEYLNTSEVTNMDWMFANCQVLKVLDLSKFKTTKVTGMSCMFFYSTNLKTIYVGDGWSTAAVTGSDYMFTGCTSLVGGQGTTYDENHVNASYAHIDGGTSNPGYFTAEGAEPWSGPQPYACYTSSNTTLTFYYDNLRSSRSGTTYDLNTGDEIPYWIYSLINYETEEVDQVTKVVFDPSFANARPTTTNGWFYDMTNLQTITGMEYLNTSEVTNMAYMFCNCLVLTDLDVSKFNTAKVTDMYGMFGACNKLTSLDLSSFNTAKVTAMSLMFAWSTQLATIYVGNGWSTAAVTTSNDMFSGCTSLVGGAGTAYNVNHLDASYAHIDGGTSNPGYFTAEGAEPWSPQPYACYTSSNTTLTFYCDNQRSSRTGTTYDLNTGKTDTGWETDHTNANVTKVVFDPSFADARPTTTYSWFWDMKQLQTITGMEYLNTSEVTNMAYMFGNCQVLTGLDVSKFNTAKVTDMYGMFGACNKLTSLDLSSFNTAKVTAMGTMFMYCFDLSTIYVGNDWNTDNVTESINMFKFCTSLVGGQGTTYDENHIDASYAHIDGGTSNPGYFTDKNAPESYACYTSENTTLTFYYDNLRNSRTGKVYDLNTDNLPAWYTDETNASVTYAVFDVLFANARPTSTYAWFTGMENLQSIEGMEYLNTSEVTNMSYMFSSCESLTNLVVSRFNTEKVTNMGNMFSGCKGLTSLDLRNFNTANVESMTYMFSGCESLTSLDVSSFNTSKVTDMSFMFRCKALTSLDVSSFNTANVTTMKNMFENCRAMTSLDLSNFNTENVTNMHAMFWSCINLRSVDLSSFNTSNVYDMSMMFNQCLVLTSLNLSNFNTANVTTMSRMFGSSEGLTKLDLSSFNTAQVTDMGSMFGFCQHLQTICVGDDWSTAAVTNSNYMFTKCTNLVGGAGTTYDENHIDASYAHIDGGTSNPGYFSSRRGDVNLDGKVDIADAVSVLNAMAGQPVAGDANVNGDYDANGNPVVDIADLVTVLNIMAGQ